MGLWDVAEDHKRLCPCPSPECILDRPRSRLATPHHGQRPYGLCPAAPARRVSDQLVSPLRPIRTDSLPQLSRYLFGRDCQGRGRCPIVSEGVSFFQKGGRGNGKGSRGIRYNTAIGPNHNGLCGWLPQVLVDGTQYSRTSVSQAHCWICPDGPRQADKEFRLNYPLNTDVLCQ
jgi:hypothetical protein